MSAGRSADILIAGGGPVGLLLGIALSKGVPGLRVVIAEAANASTGAADLRASAISAASRNMLESLGLWNRLADQAQPITALVIGDSRTADIGRPVFLTFAGSVGEGEAFAHMVPNDALGRVLREAAIGAGVEIPAPVRVQDFEASAGTVRAWLKPHGGDGTEEWQAQLLVAADGGRSRLRDLAGITTVGWAYGQSGIVVTVEHERPHLGEAREDFLPAGPFAILPLKGNRSSLVWTERTEVANRLVAADALVFRAELELRFGHQLGWVRALGPAEAYPLRLSLARGTTGTRFALCGDAAHVIHPIAGQGLNLGIKDVAALAEAIVDAARLGLDIGSEEVLGGYAAARRADVLEMGLVTDALNRLFSNDSPPLRLLRDVGLGLVDRLPSLKSAFIRKAAGLDADGPRLLRGEAL